MPKRTLSTSSYVASSVGTKLSPKSTILFEHPNYQVTLVLNNPMNRAIIFSKLPKVAESTTVISTVQKIKFVDYDGAKVDPFISQGIFVIPITRVNAILKAIMINHLKNDVVARLGYSKMIDGIGVFAIKPIKSGTFVFSTTSSKCNNTDVSIAIREKDLGQDDKAVQKLLDDFFISNDGTTHHVPLFGPNAMDISFYLNHNENSNLTIRFDCGYYTTYVAARDIKEGEELFINYCDFKINKDVLLKYMPFLQGKCKGNS